MRNTILFLFVLIFHTGHSFAQETPFDYDPKLAQQLIEVINNRNIEPYRDSKNYIWLYKLIMPTGDQVSDPDRTLKSFEVHLQDSYAKFPKPEDIKKVNLAPPQHHTGSITYVGFWPMGYDYDVLNQNDEMVIHVKIHFKNADKTDLIQMTQKIKEAEALWNASKPLLDFNYRFLFDVVSKESDAHYSIRLLDKTRGPYNVFWSRSWSSNSIKHEIGHMMGLGDEYETLSGNFYCLKKSFMCYENLFMPHHYYFILRRLLK